MPVQEDSSSEDDCEDDSDDSLYMSADDGTLQMPVQELSLPDRPRRSSADRTSGASDAPSSLPGLALRRLPRRAGSDILSPTGRSRQVSGSRRTSGSTTEFRTPASPAVELSLSIARSPSNQITQRPLVSENPKPTAPIATSYTLQCVVNGATHRWRIWANATHRRYTCLDCTIVVKERKTGRPEVWVPTE